MANDYYGRDRDFIPFTRARGDDVQFELDALEAAFDKLPTPEQVQSGQPGFVSLSGTNTLTASMPTTWTSYTGKDGYLVVGRAANTNTGTVTLNIDSLGAQSVVRNDGDALAAGDLQGTGVYQLVFNESASKFFVVNYVQSQLEDAETARDAAQTAQSGAETAESNASTSASNASSSATTSANYATKTDGYAAGTDNSAKSWSIGGTGDGQPSAGPAKDWATKAEDSTVDGVDYSALHWSKKAEAWAASVNLPSITGNALKILRAKSDETALEYVDLVWMSKPIGEPFGLRDDLTGVEKPPTNSANFRYIKLTAGEDGVGQYNEGVLISESISGSAPLVVATAVIDYAESPINGETVNLWNTEGRYPKPGTSAGTVANDQMQQITGTVSAVNTGAFGTSTGAFPSHTVDVSGVFASGGSGNRSTYTFDSASSTGARTGTSTDVKHQQLTYYMRIL